MSLNGYRDLPGLLALFREAATFVFVLPPIDFGAVARLVAPTARRGAGRPAGRFFDFACFDALAAFVALRLEAAFVRVDLVDFFLRPVAVDAADLLRLRAPVVLRVAPALAAPLAAALVRRVARSAIEAVRRTAAASRLAARLAVAPPGTPARLAARSVARPLRLSTVLVCAAARFAPVRAADPTRAAADVAALAVDVSVPAARPSSEPTASAPRSTIVIVVSAACESGSPGRVVLSSAISGTSKLAAGTPAPRLASSLAGTHRPAPLLGAAEAFKSCANQD